MGHAYKKKIKIKIMEGTELPNQESIRTLERKENYKYLRILEVYTIKQTRDERKK